MRKKTATSSRLPEKNELLTPHQLRLIRRRLKVSLPEDAPVEGCAGVQVDMRRVMRELKTKLQLLEEQRKLLHKSADKYVRTVLVESPSRPMSPPNDMPDLSEVFPEPPEFGYG